MHTEIEFFVCFRLHYVKRITSRKKRDVDLLKTRLDLYSDEWRTAQPDPLTKAKLPTNLTPTGKIRKPRLKKNLTQSNETIASEASDVKQLFIPDGGKLSRRKRSKLEKVKTGTF